MFNQDKSEVAHCVTKAKEELDKSFSRLDKAIYSKIQNTSDIQELKRAYNICLEMKCLDQEVFNAINNQIKTLQKKYNV